MFARSRDSGITWEQAYPIFDYVPAAHWFGSVSVAPSGRIDITWNDTRNTGLSELFYTYSEDGGNTWSAQIPVSLAFDSEVGGGKLGDYYDMVSDGKGAHVAYAATFNREHDIYYLRLLPPVDCNRNSVYDLDDIAADPAIDSNNDDVPDECQSEYDGDGVIDDVDPDIDADGVANGVDYCLFSRPGEPVTATGAIRMDTDGSCSVDLNDLWRFENCMAGGIGYIVAPATACKNAFDRNQDDAIDLRDFAAFQNAVEP